MAFWRSPDRKSRRSALPPEQVQQTQDREARSERRDYRLHELADWAMNGLGAGTAAGEYEIAPYAMVVRVAMPWEIWSGVFFSWLSLKGHLQGMRGYNRTELYATRQADTVLAVFTTVWDTREQIAGWLDGGYPLPLMLESLGVPPESIDLQLMRDLA